MNCALFRSNITAFQEGSLSAEAMNAANNHLASCVVCSRVFAEFKEFDTIIALEKAAEPNPFAATRILQRVDSYFSTNKAASPAWVRMLQPAALAVALLCGILIGINTAQKSSALTTRPANPYENIEFLRSNLFISEFTDEDKVLVLNK